MHNAKKQKSNKTEEGSETYEVKARAQEEEEENGDTRKGEKPLQKQEV